MENRSELPITKMNDDEKIMNPREDSPIESPWNSLEIAKLLVSVLVPISVAAVGFSINRTLQEEASKVAARANAEQQQWLKQNSKDEFTRTQDAARASETIKERVRLWQQIAIPLNDIYAYCMYVGKWKDFSATEIIKRKREVDSIVYANRSFFSDDFFFAYENFMRASFETHRGMGLDAGIRTDPDYRSDASSKNKFSGDNRQEIFTTYNSLLFSVANELHLKVKLPEKAPPKDSP